MRFNDPAQIRSARAFQRAASDIGYTFNWFYTDAKQIAYFNSGANPRAAEGPRPQLPGVGQAEVRVAWLQPRRPPRGTRR